MEMHFYYVIHKQLSGYIPDVFMSGIYLLSFKKILILHRHNLQGSEKSKRLGILGSPMPVFDMWRQTPKRNPGLSELRNLSH